MTSILDDLHERRAEIRRAKRLASRLETLTDGLNNVMANIKHPGHTITINWRLYKESGKLQYSGETEIDAPEQWINNDEIIRRIVANQTDVIDGTFEVNDFFLVITCDDDANHRHNFYAERHFTPEQVRDALGVVTIHGTDREYGRPGNPDWERVLRLYLPGGQRLVVTEDGLGGSVVDLQTPAPFTEEHPEHPEYEPAP